MKATIIHGKKPTKFLDFLFLADHYEKTRLQVPLVVISNETEKEKVARRESLSYANSTVMASGTTNLRNDIETTAYTNMDENENDLKDIETIQTIDSDDYDNDLEEQWVTFSSCNSIGGMLETELVVYV
jgi:hypothetical protein